MCNEVLIQLLCVSQLDGYFFTYSKIGTKLNPMDSYQKASVQM